MLGVGLWGGVKGNSHVGKIHRVGTYVYFGHMSSYFFFSEYLHAGSEIQLIFLYAHSDRGLHFSLTKFIRIMLNVNCMAYSKDLVCQCHE